MAAGVLGDAKDVEGTEEQPGIWHETYKIAAGQYEAIYSGMPARGLGKVSQLLAAEGERDTARGRIGA